MTTTHKNIIELFFPIQASTNLADSCSYAVIPRSKIVVMGQKDSGSYCKVVAFGPYCRWSHFETVCNVNIYKWSTATERTAVRVHVQSSMRAPSVRNKVNDVYVTECRTLTLRAQMAGQTLRVVQTPTVRGKITNTRVTAPTIINALFGRNGRLVMPAESSVTACQRTAMLLVHARRRCRRQRRKEERAPKNVKQDFWVLDTVE